MMLSEKNYGSTKTPPIHIPPWSLTTDDHTSTFPLSPNNNTDSISTVDDYSLLQMYLPSNRTDDSLPVDAHACDQFRMFEFKIRTCARARSHDWTECPFAHPGEKARRRDPRKYHYSGTPCPDFRRGTCGKGDTCEMSHGVFECWLHPARYRTQPCKDGMNCRRRVCFFAHSADQLRVLSPRAAAPEAFSPPLTESPPVSPSVHEMVASLRQLQLSKGNNSFGSISPRVNLTRPGFFSLPNTPTRVLTRAGMGYFDSWDSVASEDETTIGTPKRVLTRPGFGYFNARDSEEDEHGVDIPGRISTRPTIGCSDSWASVGGEECGMETPGRVSARPGIGYFNAWDIAGSGEEEEPVMERVESGRDLRVKMFEKLSKENPIGRVDSDPAQDPNPDVGWVSDLVM